MPLMSDAERIRKVESRDKALRQLRRADAFIVVTLGPDQGDAVLYTRSPDDLREMGDAFIAILKALMAKETV